MLRDEFIHRQILVHAVRDHVWQQVHAVGERVIPSHENAAVGGAGGKGHIEKGKRTLLDMADRGGRAALGVVKKAVELPHSVMTPIDIVRMLETDRLQLVREVSKSRKPARRRGRGFFKRTVKRQAQSAHTGKDFQPREQKPSRGEDRAKQNTPAKQPAREE